jgi:urea transport system substrate-binding protein
MTTFALDEINERGGLLGRPVKYFVRDGASNEATFAREAERLIVRDQVAALFGCWTSDCRKAVKEVVEAHRHLLFFGIPYEGLEQSPNIVYAGSCPQQQMLPAVAWCLKRNYRRFFLIGSDSVYGRGASAVLHDRITRDGGTVVGEEYVPLGDTNVGPVVAKILAGKPDVILNTLRGETNPAFFRELRAKGITPQATPTISFGLNAATLRSLNTRHVAGDLVAWGYFHGLPGTASAELVKRFQARYGDYRHVTDPMEGAYLAVRFWAQAVTDAGTTDVAAVRRALAGQSLHAPQGPGVRLDGETQHAWKYFRLARINERGEFDIIHADESPTAPEPFPRSRSRQEWEQLLAKWHKEWGGRWSNRGD